MTSQIQLSPGKASREESLFVDLSELFQNVMCLHILPRPATPGDASHCGFIQHEALSLHRSWNDSGSFRCYFICSVIQFMTTPNQYVNTCRPPYMHRKALPIYKRVPCNVLYKVFCDLPDSAMKEMR